MPAPPALKQVRRADGSGKHKADGRGQGSGFVYIVARFEKHFRPVCPLVNWQAGFHVAGVYLALPNGHGGTVGGGAGGLPRKDAFGGGTFGGTFGDKGGGMGGGGYCGFALARGGEGGGGTGGTHGGGGGFGVALASGGEVGGGAGGTGGTLGGEVGGGRHAGEGGGTVGGGGGGGVAGSLFHGVFSFRG